jgi:prophage regulatory protein
MLEEIFQSRISEMERKEKATQNVYSRDIDLAKRYGVSRVTIWRWVAKGDFPKPVSLSPGCSRWYGPDVNEWDQKRREA